jgi:hypothetical protein
MLIAIHFAECRGADSAIAQWSNTPLTILRLRVQITMMELGERKCQ